MIRFFDMRRLACLLLILAMSLATGLTGFSAAYAQDDQSEDQMSREERLRLHEERVREIIEQRRRERAAAREGGAEAMQEAQAAQAASDAAEQASQVRDAGVPGAAAADSGEPRTNVAIGNVILYVVFRIPDEEEEVQLDTVVRAKDRFVSEVLLRNENSVSYDRIRIGLKYDKRFIRPLRIFDDAIRDAVDGKPKFEIIQRDSIIVYDAKLKYPKVTKELPVLKIVWEATRPTEHTGLDFVFATGDSETAIHTGIYQNGQNILGNADDPIDGVLGGSILVLKEFDPNDTRPEILQGKREELREIYLGEVASQARVGLELEGPDREIVVGEPFDMNVKLNNPGGAILDSVQFFIMFNPEELQAIDHDQGNWIKRGINIHDGRYRLDYPFDFHKRNEVDNTRGYVNYSMALGEGLSLPTGTFAQIRFVPVAPTASTSIELIQGRPGATNRTTVQVFGFELLSADPKLTTSVYQTSILPAREGTLVASGLAEAAEGGSLSPLLYNLAVFPARSTVPGRDADERPAIPRKQ